MEKHIPDKTKRDNIAQQIYNPFDFLFAKLWRFFLWTGGFIHKTPFEHLLKKSFNVSKILWKIHIIISTRPRKKTRIYRLIFARKLSHLFKVPFHYPGY